MINNVGCCIVFRNECLPPPAIGGPLPFPLTADQFWPSLVFNPAAASAFLLGLPWHHHAAQPPSSSYQSPVHKALSQRIVTANQSWPAAAAAAAVAAVASAQTSSSEPHSPSSRASSVCSPAPMSPAQDNVGAVAASDPDGGSGSGDDTAMCLPPAVHADNVTC